MKNGMQYNIKKREHKKIAKESYKVGDLGSV